MLPIIYAFRVELLPFLTQKRTKKIAGKGGSNRGIEGSPLWIVCGKNCRRKIFWKFQKEMPKMAYQELSNIERNKVMKNQPIRCVPRGLAYHNQPGGFDLTPPCKIGLTKGYFKTKIVLVISTIKGNF